MAGALCPLAPHGACFSLSLLPLEPTMSARPRNEQAVTEDGSIETQAELALVMSPTLLDAHSPDGESPQHGVTAHGDVPEPQLARQEVKARLVCLQQWMRTKKHALLSCMPIEMPWRRISWNE
jgi:hypothetical protein